MKAVSDISNDPFKTAVYSIVKKKEDSKIFIEKLKQEGFDAMVDYFDAGYMADKPIIIFDPSSSVVKKGEKLVTEAMKAQARKKARSHF